MTLRHVSPAIDAGNKRKFTELAVFKGSVTKRKSSPPTSEMSVSVPVREEKGECPSTYQDGEDCWEGCGEEIMKDVIDELDKWDQEADSVDSIGDTKENDVQTSDQLETLGPHCQAPRKIIPSLLTNICTVNQQPLTVTMQTPCRLQNHISPVTLLPSNVSSTLRIEASKTGGTEPCCDKALKEVSQFPVPLNVIKETPPSELPTHCIPTPNARTSSSTRNKYSGNSNFKTPSTAQWIRVKREDSNSGSPRLSSTSLPGAGSGHKVTPPICGCGKRTKRKCVSSPGPNEGKMFFACPFGRGSSTEKGCGYFKWETHSLSYFLDDQTEPYSEYSD